MRKGDQDETWIKGDTLASKAAANGKPLRTDDEVTKSSEEIDLRMDDIPQEESPTTGNTRKMFAEKLPSARRLEERKSS